MPDDDHALVRAYLGGEVGAFDALLERHRSRVYNTAYRIVGPSEAEDASQEVFLTVVRKLGGFRYESAFSTWLYRVTVNVCTDLLRKRRDLPTEDPPDRPVADRTDEVAGAADVQAALAEVPLEFRVPLVLREVQDLPYNEIAELLGAPVGTVKSRIHRGRMALARALRGEPAGSSGASHSEEAS